MAKPASRRRRSVASRESDVAQLKRELNEAQEQQAATLEVLNVISSSPGDLAPVFDAILECATRLCEASHGHVWRFESGRLHAVAVRGDPEFVEWLRQHDAVQPISGTAADRIARGARFDHMTDRRREGAYRDDPTFRSFVDAGGIRASLAVALRKNETLLGMINVYRQETRPFTDEQIALLENFAAQAVIAIENARLLSELRQRTDDLTESLEQQTGTSEILRVISSSPTNVTPVLETIVRTAVTLCNSYDAVILLREGEHLRIAAHHGPMALDFEQLPLGRDFVSGRTVIDGVPVHVPDFMAAGVEFPRGREVAKRLNQRTVLGLPLRREGQTIGCLFLRRTEVLPFTDKQIELLTTFADQAVIAIENTRLLDELRESLEQQTATSEVLKVISSSPGELEPVFNAMLENATRICEAKIGNLFLWDGNDFRAVAVHGESDYANWFRRDPMARVREQSGSPLDRLIRAKQVIHIPDLRKDQSYIDGNHRIVSLVETAGARTHLVVPMLKERELVGAIVIYRQEVRPFTDKQIGLVQNFAAQAVIAIENARLLNELRQRTTDLTESLQQQTATGNVLDVISRSAFDLQPVFDTVAESAVKLCGTDRAFIFRFDGEMLQCVVAYNAPSALEKFIRNNPIRPDRSSAAGRAACERRTVHIPDVKLDPEYTFKSIDAAPIRTVLTVPILMGTELLGVILTYSLEVRPFSDRQITLVETFADQAAIAIENVKLFEAEQQRTRELSISLGQQTATADVLKIISRSAFDLRAVLDTLLRSAGRLCAADMGVIARRQDDLFYRTVAYGLPEDLGALIDEQPVELSRNSGSGRALLEGKVIHIHDIEADPEYTHVSRGTGAFRTLLGVPMVRDGVPVGVMTLMRKSVLLFTDKEMELVSTFADQAAIAIENVRLFEAEQQRTQELAKSLEELRAAQDRLVQTQKLASLGQLTAGIAHEIKNPLNFVNNFSGVSVELIGELQDALKTAPLDEKARAEIDDLADTLRGNLDKIAQHGKRADSIVKNMLLHSREGSGEQRPVDINAIVEESLNLAYHGARAEKQGFTITLERSFDPDAGQADLYPQEISRALLNFITNGFYAAIKRGAEAGNNGYEPRLATSTKNLGNRVEIRIRDNGTGIPPEVKEKMFNPFFTTKPAGEGTGLGLSISHDIIVKQHAGSIEVDSTPGEFTEIRIVLPRTVA